MTASAQAVAAHQLADRIIASSVYQSSQHIAVYWAVGGEISLQPLMGMAYECQKVDAIQPEPWDVTLHSVYTDLTEIKADQSS
jgi:5-formyltetrahydrofolate cyclo-ligase